MGLLDRFKQQTHPKASEKNLFFKWLNMTLAVELASEIHAINFNLYEDAENKWSIELVGTSTFDGSSEDWACCEVFSTRDNPFVIERKSDWKAVEEMFRNWVNDYLRNGKYADKLKQFGAVGLGFVDGDIRILFKR